MPAISEGTTLWTPSPRRIETANLTRYTEWAANRTGRSFASYDELWRWSITDLDGFWASLWDYFDIKASTPYDEVLSDRAMPGARWFTGARLSFAEHIFRSSGSDRPAIVFSNETDGPTEVSWSELEAESAAISAFLRSIGVEPGDRVVSYMPNIPQTIAAFLGAASIGAIWSSWQPQRRRPLPPGGTEGPVHSRWLSVRRYSFRPTSDCCGDPGFPPISRDDSLLALCGPGGNARRARQRGSVERGDG